MQDNENALVAEIQRTRQRLHKIEASVQAIGMKLDHMNGRLADLETLEPKVDRLERANEIAEAVTAKMKERGDVISITWIGKAIGALVCGASIASVILQATGHR